MSKTKQSPPDPTEISKFAWYHVSGNWHHIKAALLPVLILVILSFGLGFLLAYQLVLASKDSTIENLRTANELLYKENEKLSRQVSELRIYRTDSRLGLKQKALILSQQIREFIAPWKDSDSPDTVNANVWKYLKRFGLRASIIRDDLDQTGQHSDAFDRVIDDFQSSYADVRTIAEEIERLAQKLPD